ncbi:choline/Carnitine O-acyltransferase [Thraustotheca clavata]|uniref:Choline/Carnitine O-acyltransferase n=1 Tax=Thraustotheca clavata TaxID=74557 RepID=A0A1V9YWI7_9STRA|nr:choline/Carnitine O-acyltransferase [Thraustotheca clavata]
MKIPRGVRAMSTKQPSWFLRMVDNNVYDLPRLPVPQLNETLERYLRSVQPLVTPAEFKEHKKLVEDFGLGANRSVGRILQDELLKQEFVNVMGRAYPYSYIEEWWDAMYLGGRYPNPINVNPGYGLIEEASGTVLADPLVRTSTFLTSFLKWFQKMKAGELEQDPKQCMSSFAKQLGTAKIPQKDCDILAFHPQSSHIVVLKDNAFYKVNVFDGKKLISKQSLEKQLHSILHTKVTDAPNIAVLTADERDSWATNRAQLIAEDPINKASIEAIDSALIVLVLDEKSYSGSELTAMTLHGNGSNRWFDKHQILMYGDGHLATNFEHTFSDGTAWNRWLHETWHDMRHTDSGFSPLSTPDEFEASADAVQPLKWSLSPALHQAIANAEALSTKDIANTDSKLLNFDHYGKNTIKTWGMSPDGAVQMAYQLAYYREHGRVPPTYESCSTRAFFHGRTETIRSATNEALRFVTSVSSEAPIASQKEFLKKAVDRHVVLAKEAQQGLGCDRHLTMLNYTAKQSGIDHPFLSSPIRANSTNFQLSTSNVTMPFLQYFTFGAVVPSGYGLGYLIQNNSIPINITSYKDSNLTDSAKFSKSVTDALDTVRVIAEST